MMNNVPLKSIVFKSVTLTNPALKLMSAIACTLLLSSCVYYSVQRDLGGNEAEPCTKGSSKQNAQCKAEIKAINAEINNSNNQ